MRHVVLLSAVVLAACATKPMQPTYVMFSSMEDAHANTCDVRTLFPEPCLLPTLAAPETLDSIASGTHVRASGDTLTFAVEIAGVKSVSILGGIESTMQRIGGDLWAATVFVPRASDAIISYRFITDTMTVAPKRAEFRGENAPAPLLRSQQLHGTIRVDTLGERVLVSYVPPGPQPKKPYDVIYAADGAYVRDLAPLIDTLIVDGHIKPTVIVGVRAAPGNDRAREYVYGFDVDSTRFLAHEKFFMQDVAVWAEKTLHVSAQRNARTIWGSSNGGSFAVAMGLRHPDRFQRVIASAPVYDQIPKPAPQGTLPSFYLTAGTLEETTRSRTSVLNSELKKLHAETRLELTVSGHDELVWHEWFIRGLIGS